MNPYDKEKTRQIWKRVLGEEEQCECRAFDSERLREQISAEKCAAWMYRALARRVSGSCREQLCGFAKEALAHSKRLETVYFLWTGECACAAPEERQVQCCVAEGLRDCYQMETESVRMLRQTAEELPEYAAIFCTMAEETSARAARLLKLLECYV